MVERQTLSYLSQRLGQAGVHPKVRYGQNFLIDMNLLDLLTRAADIQSNDVILEVGTGAGSLTTRMAPLAARVITIEIDRDLIRLAEAELASFSNVQIMKMDALKNKNHMQDEILEAIRTAMSEVPNASFKLVANLPYNVATPIISNLLCAEPLPDRMVVTIQKELAERITAKPRTKDYSALSIWMQSQCDCEIVRVMPPSVFWPRPKVDSAIISIRLNRENRDKIADLEFFHETVRGLFLHRRKFLRSALVSAMKDRLDKQQVDDLLQELGHNTEARAEELSIPQFRDLVDACKRRLSLPN